MARESTIPRVLASLFISGKGRFRTLTLYMLSSIALKKKLLTLLVSGRISGVECKEAPQAYYSIRYLGCKHSDEIGATAAA